MCSLLKRCLTCTDRSKRRTVNGTQMKAARGPAAPVAHGSHIPPRAGGCCVRKAAVFIWLLTSQNPALPDAECCGLGQAPAHAFSLEVSWWLRLHSTSFQPVGLPKCSAGCGQGCSPPQDRAHMQLAACCTLPRCAAPYSTARGAVVLGLVAHGAHFPMRSSVQPCCHVLMRFPLLSMLHSVFINHFKSTWGQKSCLRFLSCHPPLQ